MHHCCLAHWQLKGAQSDVAVKEPSLVDEPQDLRFGHGFFTPLLGPILKHVLGNFGRRLVGTEEELFGLAAHQDQAEVDLISWDTVGHDDVR